MRKVEERHRESQERSRMEEIFLEMLPPTSQHIQSFFELFFVFAFSFVLFLDDFMMGNKKKIKLKININSNNLFQRNVQGANNKIGS